ncbi:MAG: hypothetical protein WC455_18015 [Dehalococcoidia bacterium]|jgi:hypothetical protein
MTTCLMTEYVCPLADGGLCTARTMADLTKCPNLVRAALHWKQEHEVMEMRLQKLCAERYARHDSE